MAEQPKLNVYRELREKLSEKDAATAWAYWCLDAPDGIEDPVHWLLSHSSRWSEGPRQMILKEIRA